MKVLSKAIGAILCVLLASTAVWAQATAGAQVSGTVTDESRNTVPGVEITVTQSETGLTRTAVSSAEGNYLFPNLPIGPYQLQAKKQGFKTSMQTGIVLQVNSNPEINVKLTVGAVTDSVEVTSGIAMVDTFTNAVGQVMTTSASSNCP